jgi:hypothetical protein
MTKINGKAYRFPAPTGTPPQHIAPTLPAPRVIEHHQPEPPKDARKLRDLARFTFRTRSP